MTGDSQEGAALDAKSASQIAAQNANIKIAHFHGAGHDIRRDKYDQYVQTVKEFLTSLGN
jgi:hypothetical protein